jgi:hypothetical protein
MYMGGVCLKGQWEGKGQDTEGKENEVCYIRKTFKDHLKGGVGMQQGQTALITSVGLPQ